MKNAKTTAFSGCLIWILLVTIIGSCVMPLFIIVGSFSSVSESAIQTTGGWLCPEETRPRRYSYATTSRDENGFERPSTAYELHCLDAEGEVVETDPVGYAFLWIGIAAGLGVLASAGLSLVFAVPGGVLVTRLLEKWKGPAAGGAG